MVKVFHNGVKPARYLLIFFHITAPKLGILLAEGQWLPGLKWRLVIQTLRVTAPPPGTEEQQQDGEKVVKGEGVLQDASGDQIAGLYHRAVSIRSLSSG